MARQNLIFQVALEVPRGDGEPWLERVLESGDAQDQEDALVALAFGGHRGAIGAFVAWRSCAAAPTFTAPRPTSRRRGGNARGERFVEAARWYSKASLLPDRDQGTEGRRGLIACLELLLDLDALGALAADAGCGGQDTLVHDLAWLRRLAVERGCAAAVLEAASIADRRPDGVIGRAWRRRMRSPSPRGLSGGRAPLEADDRLLAIEPTPPGPPPGPPFPPRVCVQMAIHAVCGTTWT